MNLLKRKNIAVAALALLATTAAFAQFPPHAKVAKEAEMVCEPINLFEQIDYSYHPRLEKVEKLYKAGKRDKALEELLAYYRYRINEGEPFRKREKAFPRDINMAENALDYRFYIKNYTEDDRGTKGQEDDLYYQFGNPTTGVFDWYVNPFAEVIHSQFHSQLQRHQWMVPQAKAYAKTGDERYAKNFVEVFDSWIKEHPMVPQEMKEYTWNELGVSSRIAVQTELIYYYINSPHFTADVLEQYLVNFIRHVEYMRDDYRNSSNILIAQCYSAMYAGIFFPELKLGDKARQELRGRDWLEEGVVKLATELSKQFFDDGFHEECALGYHAGVVGRFFTTLELSQKYGFEELIERSGLDFKNKLYRSTEVLKNLTYPDSSTPCFNDSFSAEEVGQRRELIKYSEIFPDDKELLWMASYGKKGEKPTHNHKYFTGSGFYVLRNGWNADCTMMIHTNNPRCWSHNQADNGTFELWHNGRNFFPDSGAYTYNTDEHRVWFRSARNHNTLTLNGEAISDDNRRGRYVYSESQSNAELIVTENQSYDDLLHRRSIFMVDNSFFVIVDEATGSAEGEVNLNFHIGGGRYNGVIEYDADDKLFYNEKGMGAYTKFDDDSNIAVRTFADKGKSLSMCKWEGKASYITHKYAKRKAYSVDMAKSASEGKVRYVTVIVPTTDNRADERKIDAKFTSSIESDEVAVRVSIDGKKYDLGYKM